MTAAASSAVSGQPFQITLDVWSIAEFRAQHPTAGLVWISSGALGQWVAGWMNGRSCGFCAEEYWRARGFVPVYFAPTPPPPDEWRET